MFLAFKRLFDFASATLLFVVILPLFMVLALIVRIQMGKPFYFTQQRTTKGHRVFKLIKFRSMTNARDENGELLPDEMRRTRFGNWLRATSLDELPELINIIKGDMSVIGPRPLVIPYEGYYKESEESRFAVRGGLIPPEVLHGVTNPSWDEQLQWEAEYGRNCSFVLDFKILWSVFVVLFKRNRTGFGAVTRASLLEERKKDNG